jgi:hypothetical protein
MTPANTQRYLVFVLSEHVVKIIATIFKGFKFLNYFKRQTQNLEFLHCVYMSQ